MKTLLINVFYGVFNIINMPITIKSFKYLNKIKKEKIWIIFLERTDKNEIYNRKRKITNRN